MNDPNVRLARVKVNNTQPSTQSFFFFSSFKPFRLILNTKKRVPHIFRPASLGTCGITSMRPTSEVRRDLGLVFPLLYSCAALSSLTNVQ
jgi:hypothetical protein